MTLLSLSIGCGLAVLILSKIISSVITRRRCQAEAARRGCEPAPALRNMGFMGLTLTFDYLKAMREERGPPMFVEAMNELGTNGNIHTARVEGESHSVAERRIFDFDADSVGLRGTGDPGP